jgi:ribulose kinase
VAGGGAIAEQSSEEIWRAVCRSGARRAGKGRRHAGHHTIAGIGFDLLAGGAGQRRRAADRNIIVWMDSTPGRNCEPSGMTGLQP